VASTTDPDVALNNLEQVTATLGGKAVLYELFSFNPPSLKLYVDLCDSPFLSQMLVNNPGMIDDLLDSLILNRPRALADLQAELAELLRGAGAPEAVESIRHSFRDKEVLRIAVRDLLGKDDVRAVTAALSDVADALLGEVAAREEAAMRDRFGSAGPHAVLALGKLGGREMSYHSDLDLILIYEGDGRTLPPPDSTRWDTFELTDNFHFFTELAQRLIKAAGHMGPLGRLYQVDMRLRPSGRSGPLATKLDSFASYQNSEAWTWEHMALTRARVVSASPAFKANVERVIRQVLARSRDRELVAGDVVEMRRAIATEKGDSEGWDLKYAAGGIIDLEFIAQFLQLVHAADTPEILDTSTARVLDKAWRLGVIETADAECLRNAARLYHDLTQILRLCLSGPLDRSIAGAGLLKILARAADVPDFATLEAHLAETQDRVRASFVRILGSAP
jgi:glutamate-ammonia-ligase adenylyltransferase